MMPTFDDILLLVFCLGGFLLVASVFLGELRMAGQRVNTGNTGGGFRLLAGAIGVALVVTAAVFISSTHSKPLAPALCALVISGLLALVAVARGKFGTSSFMMDGEAVGGFARGFSILAALLIGTFGLFLLLRNKSAEASPQPSCPAGSRREGSACVPMIPTSDSTSEPPLPRQKPVWRHQIYIQIASEKAEPDANERAEREAQTSHRSVCVFESKRAFGIAFGPLAKADAYDMLPKLKSDGLVPEDAFVAPVDDSQIRSCYPRP